jgi:hypothetical protein
MSKPFVLINEDGELIFSRQFALLDPYDDKGNFVLQEEFWVQWQAYGSTYRIRLPKGLITDIASVPRIVWTISGILPDGLQRNAAIIHDAGYMWHGSFPPGWFQKQVREKWQNVSGIWSKDELDRLFLRIMKACGVNPVKRWLMYKAVAWFGGPAWRRNDPAREKYRNAFA